METRKDWWKNSVIYQIYPRSFMDSNGDGIGDLNGIRQKLDYLKLLGVDVLWLSPVYASPNADNGYDISDYRAIMEDFGTMEDFDAFLAEAHEKGLKIVMDLVVNHTSDEHAWFLEARSSKENPYRDYYIWKDGDTEPNNWGSVFSGSAWEKDEATNQWYLHLFASKQPDLNWENEKVRQEVYSMMTWWLDKGVDGFRMDVINLISKDQRFLDAPTYGGLYGNSMIYTANGPRVHEFLKEMNRNVLSKYDIVTVGEAPGVTVEEAKKYTSADENELNMVFQFEMMSIDQGEYGKWTPIPFDLRKMKQNFKKWQEGLADQGWNSLYWNNHDQPRIVSRFGNASEEWRKKSAKMLGLCLHMHQGTPYIYQGEEIGMTNVRFDSIEDYKDVEILNAYKELVKDSKRLSEDTFMEGVYRMSRDNARTPMQWNDQKNGGFSSGQPWIGVNPNYRTINAEEALADPDSVFYFYQKLIDLRHKLPILTNGVYKQYLEEDENVYVFSREGENESLVVLCNFSRSPQHVVLPDELVGNAQLLLSNEEEKELQKEMDLTPYEGIVYQIKK